MLQKIMENSISYCIMLTLYKQCLVYKTTSKMLIMAKYNVPKYFDVLLATRFNNHNIILILKTRSF